MATKQFFRPETFAKALPGKLDKLLGPGREADVSASGWMANATRFWARGRVGGNVSTSIREARPGGHHERRNRYGLNQDR